MIKAKIDDIEYHLAAKKENLKNLKKITLIGILIKFMRKLE